MDEQAKNFIDGTAIASAFAAVLAWMPAIASALSVIWMTIRIWETKTVQDLLKGWKK